MLSRFLLCALSLSSLLSTVSAAGIAAGDFEDVAAADQSWNLKYAAVDTNAANAHSGSNSVRSVVSPVAPAGTLARIQQYLTVPSACPDGSAPSLSFWYFTQGSGVSAAVHVYQAFEDTHPRTSTEVHQSLPASATYTQTTANLGVFAGYQVALNVEFLGADAQATLNADDFTIC